jgi:uncharacterized protein (TIGR04255 family)
MSVLEKLIPFNGKGSHSISEAIFSIILPNKILEPKRFETLIRDDGSLKDKFQSFKVLEGTNISVNVKFNDFQPQLTSEFGKTGDNGFQFEGYKEGKLTWLIRCLPNQPLANILSIHCLDYSRWDDFYTNVFLFLKGLSSIDNGIFLTGFSLNYIDQFDWIDEKPMPVKNIFVGNGVYIPKRLIETDEPWNYSLNYQTKVGGHTVLEHINLGTRKVILGKENIFITHTAVLGFPSPKNLSVICQDSIGLKEIADKMHLLNKDFLKNVLVEDISNAIGL